MTQLPQELIDKIIDTIATESVSNGLWSGADLMQCSLVSRSFRPRCLIHIFSTVRIRAGLHEMRKRKIKKLADIIENHPQIARHIEELTMEFGTYPTVDGVMLVIEQVFIDVMEKISPLQKLTLASSNIHDLKHPLLLMNSFLLPFIAPSITSLKIHCLKHVPVEVVTSCVNLSSLGVSFASLTGRGQNEATNPHVPQTSLQLKRFSYQNSRIALDIILRPSSNVDLSHLQTLTAYTDHASFNHVQELLGLCSESLEEFHLLTMEDTACKNALYTVTSAAYVLTTG